MRLRKYALTIITAAGLGLGLGWGLAVQQVKAQEPAKTKEMKDPKEYALFEAYQKAAPKDKPAALDAWKKDFPNSEFAEDRETMYLFALNDLKDPRKIFDKAVEILKTRPNYYYAIQFVLGYVSLLNPLQPADLDVAERTAKHVLDDPSTIFAAANKPDPGMKDDAWAAAKQPGLLAAQRTYAWVFFTRKDWPKAETEITKYLQMDGTQAIFSYYLGQSLVAQNKEHPEKAPPALFHVARAAAYDGQNSLTAAQKTAPSDFLTKTYTAYHCSNQGLPELLTLAKTNVFPPAGFNIKTCADLEREKAQAEAEAAAKDPVGTFWRETIKKNLIDDPTFFSMALEGALIPGDAGKATNVTKFKAKLISQTPANKPKQLVMGLEKGDVPDITLVFEEALPGNMEPGSVLEFEGVAKAFTKEPFMLTLEVTKDQLVGWTGTNPTNTKAKQATKAGGTKAGTKGGTTKGGPTK